MNAPSGAVAAISDEADSPRQRRERLLAFAAFVAICSIWGTTFLAIRVAVETIPTLYLTGVRFTAAGVILLVIAALRGQPMPRRASQWGHEAVTGILLFSLANGAVVWAEHYIASGLAALLAATLPLWMALLERFGKHSERLPSGRIAGLIVGFCGVAAVVSPALVAPRVETGLILGVLAMQFYAVTWNLGTLLAKYRPSGLPSSVAPALQMLLGGLLTLVAGAVTTPWHWSYLTLRSGLSLAYLSLFGSVIAYSAFHYALRVVPPGKLTLFAYAQPAVAAIAGLVHIALPFLSPQDVSSVPALSRSSVSSHRFSSRSLVDLPNRFSILYRIDASRWLAVPDL